MESRDISYYNSSSKTYNTPVNCTSVSPNSQLPHFDPFKPAEYVLNNLGPVPGEEKIYAKLFKQNVQNTGGASSSVGNSKSVEVNSVIVVSDEDDKPKDGDHVGDKDKLFRLYSHKLHIRKPRVPYARISFDDSGIFSDSDEFA
ncbi:17182_t:CDS:2 [Cetraspora pellucida]|uniref:17182_t:CDS:1 n=1 Tax=Cetraspora pellucida TaxID=1433469 RepID=A0A9N9NJ90_9GLOM|nr:17182_t:CDS:2 [Cetraspora pellucida]